MCTENGGRYTAGLDYGSLIQVGGTDLGTVVGEHANETRNWYRNVGAVDDGQFHIDEYAAGFQPKAVDDGIAYGETA